MAFGGSECVDLLQAPLPGNLGSVLWALANGTYPLNMLLFIICCLCYWKLIEQEIEMIIVMLNNIIITILFYIFNILYYENMNGEMSR